MVGGNNGGGNDGSTRNYKKYWWKLKSTATAPTTAEVSQATQQKRLQMQTHAAY
jgi:hypothetical protein